MRYQVELVEDRTVIFKAVTIEADSPEEAEHIALARHGLDEGDIAYIHINEVHVSVSPT